jgi:DNA polymerase-1
MSAEKPTFYILDAFSLIFQVFHAIQAPMSGPVGQPTQAVFGSFRDLLNLLKNRKPDYIAAAFDGEGPVFRSELFTEYKAQRKEMPQDLQPQIPVIRRLYGAFNVPVLVYEGMEADDVIATLARRGEERGLDVYICSADKDARQLLSDQIKIFNVRKNQVFDAATLQQDWGVTPGQVIDLLALSGDSVDNVPGVPGIGIKTGAKLLQEYGDLETILANASKVAGAKKQQNLRDYAEQARLGQRLIALREDLPLDLDWDALKFEGYNARALRAMCQECGFKGFLNEIVDEGAVEPPWVAEYQLVDTQAAFQKFLTELKAQPRVCIKTETTAKDPLRAELVGLAFSWAQGTGYYLPLAGQEYGRGLNRAEVLNAVRPVLADPEVEKIAQDIKYDILVLRQAGLEIAGPITDPMVLSYLLESGERNHELDDLSRRYLDHTLIPHEALDAKSQDESLIDRADAGRVAEYADATWRLEAILGPRVREEGLWSLYADLERPLIRILAGLQEVGVKIDVEKLKQLSAEFGARLDRIEARIYEEAGRPFNINSSQQLRQVLFHELKLPVLTKTPGGEPSTAVEVLEELAAQHPLPKLLIEHRQLTKLKGTYLDALGPLVHKKDGRVHASFNQVVAATGRLSSHDPNLQNIPVRTEDGRQIRQAFVPGEEGWSLLTADYSQVELRILAHLSGDPALKAAFADDRDIHAVVAAQIFGVTVTQVNDDQRRVAKTVNFGVIYGLSAFGLAGRLDIPQKDAAAFIDAYFRDYAGVDTFITSVLEEARKTGRVQTMLGRRRPIMGIKSTTGRNRNQAERLAVNTVIQGSAADLIKRAMILVDHGIRMQRLKARMLLQIHDELVFEAPDQEIPALAALVREGMTTALDLSVPLKVDLSAGKNWLDVVSV